MVFIAILFLLLSVGSVFYYRRKLKFTLDGLSSYKSASETKDHKINELRIQIRDLENETKDKDKTSEASKKYIEELEAYLSKAREAIDEVGSQYEKKLSNMESNSRKLSNDLMIAGSDISNLKDLLAEKDKVNNSLIETNKGLLEKIADMKKQNMSLISSAGGYEKSNISLRETISKLQAEFNENVKIHNKLVEEYEKAMDELEALRNQTEDAIEEKPTEPQQIPDDEVPQFIPPEEVEYPVVEKKEDGEVEVFDFDAAKEAEETQEGKTKEAKILSKVMTSKKKGKKKK